MQPLWLLLENFGPYQHTKIDFQKLAQDTVFLISGKTGSGKTTIFDAMCFALFNRTSGNERQGQQMRAKFAEPTALTQVTFAFQVATKQYEIQRLPKQVVAKKRGNGSREQPAKVILKIYQAEHQIAEYTKESQVKSTLEQVLHLDADQFAQIILLPQGEFQRFLTANSDDKERVLRRLFGTERYAKWTQQMQQVFNQQQNQSKEKFTQLTQLVQQIHWADTPPEVTDPTALGPLLARELDQQQQALAQAKVALKQQQAKVQSAQVQLNHGEQVLKWQTALAAKKQALATLTAQQAQATAWQQQVTRLTQLQQYQNTFKHWQQQQNQVAQQKAALQATAQALAQQQVQLTQLQQQATALAQQQPTIQRQRQQYHVWQALKPAVQQLAKTTADLTAAQQAQQQDQSALQAAQTQQQVLAQQLAQYQQLAAQQAKRLQQQTTIEKRQQQITVWQEQLQTLQQQATDLAQQTKIVAATVQAQQAAIAACTTQTATTRQLKSQWAAEQISRLQQLLVPGEPCPVCGATTHSVKPQTVSPATVTQAQVTASEAALATAQQLVTQRQTQLKNQQAQLTQQQQAQAQAQQALAQALQAASILTTTAPTLAQMQQDIAIEQQQIQQQLTAAQQAYQASQVAQAKVTTLQAQQQAKVSEVAQLQQTVQTQQLAITRLQTQQQDLQAQMPAQYQNTATFEQALTQLAADLTAFEQHQQQLQQAQQQGAEKLAALQAQQVEQQQQLEQQQTALTAQIATLTTGLKPIWPTITPPFTAYAKALTEIDQLPILQEKLAHYHTQQLTLTTEIDQLQQELGQQQPPDLTDLKAALVTTQTTLDHLTASYYQQQQQLQANQHYQQQLAQGLQEQSKTLQTLSEQARLVNVVTGNNAKKLSLERYVLQQYLQQVLQVANQRLLPLTNGRYQLQLNDATGSYRNQTGLELNIFDDSVGAVRSVQTLSGGESFITALALALAFGEVIQAQNGQTRIETLFIDEGFGSLDAEALDTALTALESLHATHQMIGIISHVTTLRDRIPNQLQVIMDGGGQSHVRYQLPTCN